MSRVFVTGSSAGLGYSAARLLASAGHEVLLHARNDERATEVHANLPEATGVVVGDLVSIEGMRQVAEAADATGRFDAVIHNAGIGYREPCRIVTPDGLSHVFAVNVLAPYLLTSLMDLPQRLVYLGSRMHRAGSPDLGDPQWKHRPWNGVQAYADSKLFDVILAFAVARRRPDVLANAVEPGWAPTKMGGADAPDDIYSASATQAWLAVSNESGALVSGCYFFRQHIHPFHSAAENHDTQEQLLAYCGGLTGVMLRS